VSLKYVNKSDNVFSQPQVPVNKDYPLAPVQQQPPPHSKKTKNRLIVGFLGFVVLIAIVVVLVVILRHRNTSDNGSPGSPGSDQSRNATSGMSGSTITMDDGTKFLYQNSFGGDWVADPKIPFGPGGKAQSWSKRIGAEEWVWGQDVARGVNLG